MKKLKSDLEIWNRDVFGNVKQLGEDIQKKKLDARDDNCTLDDEGREERRFLLVEQIMILFKQVVIHQNVRLKWLKQGYLNSKFFHSVVKW